MVSTSPSKNAPGAHVAVTDFDGRRASVTVTIGSERYVISLSSREEIKRPVNFGDVWLPLALIPAMASGLDLHITDSVSAKLLANVDMIQTILATWYPELTPVRVTAPVRRRRPRQPKPHYAQLFTGGVDSFFTLISHPEVETLMYVHDMVHETAAVRAGASELLASVSKLTGKRLVEFDSDARILLDPYGEWGPLMHGAALASMAALGSTTVTTMFFPSSHTFLELGPWASHPVLDYLWSGDVLSIVHDGAHATRYDKVAAVSLDDIAVAHLRVCWRTQAELNCSVCEKCLRTMTSLEIMGKLKQASTFDGELDLAAVSAVELSTDSDVTFGLDNIAAARAAGREDIAAAIEVTIARYEAAQQAV